MNLKPVKPNNPPAVPQKADSTLSKAEQLIASKGKTLPTWESIVNTIELIIAAFEQVFGGGVLTASSDPVPPKSTKVVLKG